MDLKKLYKDPKFSGAFAGQRQFYRSLKAKYPTVKWNQVKNYLKSDDGYTLHRPVKKPRKFRRVYTKHIGYLIQIDLVDMSALAKYNKNWRWIITVIDTFSKKLWAFKTKRKTGLAVTNALKDLLTTIRPIKISYDDGKEFLNRHFQTLLRRLKIKGYSTESLRKNSLVERVNRTLKTRMYRAFTSRGSRVWWDILPDLVAGYNSSYHRSIKRAPNEVNAQNQAEVRDILFPPDNTVYKAPRLKVGDTVRVTRKKSIFQKGYEQNWSYEVFKVSEIKDTKPVTYAIEDHNSNSIKGSYYERQLQICDKSSGIFPIERVIRKRKYRGRTQYLVKYIGYSDLFNSWVDQSDLFDL